MKRNIVILCMVAAALRFYGLGSESLWLDEGHTVALIRLGWDKALGDATQGPLFLVLAKLFALMCGESEWSLRLLPALLGTAVVPIVYLFAKSLFDERTAFWSAVAVAVNPFLIHFSQDARPYALFLFCGVCSLYFALELSRQYRPGYLLGFGLSALAALYSHVFGMFLFPVWIGEYLLVRFLEKRRGTRELQVVSLSLCTLALLYVPLVVRVLARVDEAQAGVSLRGAWIPVPTLVSVAGTVAKYFFFVPLAAAVVLVIAYALYAARSPGDRMGLLTCGAILICSLGLPYVASLLFVPSYVHRYTINGITGILILCGWSLSRIDRFTFRIALAGLAVLSLIPLFTYYTMVDKEPWRDAAHDVLAGYRSGDIILAQPFYTEEPLNYYLPDSLKIMTIPRTQDPANALTGLGRVWLITAYGREEAAHTDAIVAALQRDHRESYRVDLDERIRKNPWGYWTASIMIRRFDSAIALERNDDRLQ